MAVTYARSKNLAISSQKMGLVLDMIRGRLVAEARPILETSPKKGAALALKTLNSAVANATKVKGESADGLWVAEARADGAPMLKRWRPRARGQADRLLKRRTHLTIGVGPNSPAVKVTG